MMSHRLAAVCAAAFTLALSSQAPALAAPAPTPDRSPGASRTAAPRTDPGYLYYLYYSETVQRNPWLGDYLEGTVEWRGDKYACGGSGVRCWARHRNGVVDVSASVQPPAPPTGDRGHAIRYPIAERYLGWIRQNDFPVGPAVTDSFCGLLRSGCGVHTGGGSVYWSADSGTHWARGRIKDRWAATGWENGRLGYPVSDEFCGLRDNGCGSHFQGGSIYWTYGTDAWDVGGLFHQVWSDLGWENGWLAYPTGPEVFSGDVVTQQFQGGMLRYNFRTGELDISHR